MIVSRENNVKNYVCYGLRKRLYFFDRKKKSFFYQDIIYLIILLNMNIH